MNVWLAFLMPFLPFVYGYLSSSPHAPCTSNKSVPTLYYTHRHGPIYTGPRLNALTVPWISEDRLFWLDYGLKRVLLFTQILFQKCIGHHLSPAPRIWRTSQSGKKCMWFVSVPQLNPKIHPVSGEKVARATNSPHPYVLSNMQVQC